MLCSHTPLRRFNPEPHTRANLHSYRDRHPRLHQGTRVAGLYLVDVSSPSSALLVSSTHAIRARSGEGAAHGDRILIAA
jgi:hypothetical protein